MTRYARRFLAGAVVLLSVVQAAGAQSLADRVGQVRNGQVRMSFTARPGVCGNGRNIVTSWSTDDWESDCEPGPVRVSLEVRDGRVADVHTYVGGHWRSRSQPATDLGFVDAVLAAPYLLSVARRTGGHGGSDVILAATMADGVVVWPQLLEIARDHGVMREVRRSAVFWLGQAAGDAAVDGLTGLVSDTDEDVDVKEHAIFALSQLKQGDGVEPLIRIARSNPEPRLRKKAIFWLAQSNDPRALALFEELLTKR